MSCNSPESVGVHSISMFLINDSYLGCDQEFTFEINVVDD